MMFKWMMTMYVNDGSGRGLVLVMLSVQYQMINELMTGHPQPCTHVI